MRWYRPIFKQYGIAREYRRLLTPLGLVAMNIIGTFHRHHDSSTLRHQMRAFRTVFRDTQIFPTGQQVARWLTQNFLLIGQMLRRDISWLRTQAMQTVYTSPTSTAELI
jgi:hypothetical protein